jgi:hypothetical protein
MSSMPENVSCICVVMTNAFITVDGQIKKEGGEMGRLCSMRGMSNVYKIQKT